jgi:hypothetical protein
MPITSAARRIGKNRKEVWDASWSKKCFYKKIVYKFSKIDLQAR